MPADLKQRQRALDPARSFIVQAPAGSGKTEMLIQRFLRLLATVSRPERVLAITFTRKATQQMRERITARLMQAERREEPEEAHDRQALALARAVLERDCEAGWNLVRNPARLRITTIDGLCMQLLGRDPVHGARWTGVRVLENAAPLHREAVRRLFADVDELVAGADSEGSAQIAQEALVELLVYLGGDAQGLEDLLVGMLEKRSMWRRHIDADPDVLDALLRERQLLALEGFVGTLGEGRLEEAITLASRLGHTGPALQGDAEDRLRAAVAFARCVATTSLKPMKPVSLKRYAFPEMDETQEPELDRFKEIYTAWHEDPAALEMLERMASWPPLDLPVGRDTLPATLLDNARSVLKLLLVELDTLMAETGEADFSAVTEAALESLGSETAPAEALLAEDARIEHILMDEFQDTSHTQFGLLRRLTAGWEAGDGRSLFLVGDPMQSIYRFREANVGFFNDVVQRGRLGQVPIESLTLTSNFRSRRELIDWFNQVFSGVFPKRDESDSGAVSYTPVHPEKGEGGVVHVRVLPEDEAGSDVGTQVLERVREALADPANESIAVLVRTRSRVREITAALSAGGIEFEAVHMEGLAGRPVVQDLRILSRALLHPLDRVAWIALLRAPWCGLKIAEIHRVVGEDPRVGILQAIGQALREFRLDAESTMRLQRVHDVMTHACARHGRDPVSALVELCWEQLGGSACCAGAESENAETFFEILEEVEQYGATEVVERLEEALEERYSASRPAQVKIMTIHNAKGLQFDAVIIPELQRGTGRPERTLIALQEFLAEDSEGGVLMAPYTPAHLADTSIYRYLNRVDAERQRFEDQRVLYVACTRAKRELHLLARVKRKANGDPAVNSNTFLGFLAEAFAPHFEGLPVPSGDDEVSVGGEEPPAISLLRLDGPLPAPDLRTPDDDETRCALRHLPDREAVALGTVLHRWLELIHDHPDQAWDAARIERSAAPIRDSLARACAPADRLDALQARCTALLCDALADQDLMAAIGPNKNVESWSELALYRREGTGFSRNVIDLLLRDEAGALHVIDYKTGQAAKDGLANEAWQAQLDRYRELLEALGAGPVSEARVRVLGGDERPEENA